MSNLIFAALFAVSILLFCRILLPFVMPVLLGGFLVVLFTPVHDALARWLGGWRRAAAGLATAAVFALILAPLAAVTYLVARELVQAAGEAQLLLERVNLRGDLGAALPAWLRPHLQLDPGGRGLQDAIFSVAAGGAGLLPGLLSTGTGLAVDLLILTVATYYFFLDGRRLVQEGIRLVPMDGRYLRQFCREFQDVAHAIIYGNTLTALVQGLVALVGLWLARVPHSPLWAVATVAVALIPVGGTALVWAPIGLGLLAAGRYADGLFLLGWGTLVVGTIDNILRPRLCGSRLALHPLLVFLSMFGGLAVFGMMGLLVGPFIASIFMAMIRIYRHDFLGLGAVPPPPEPSPAPASAPAAAPAVEPAPVPSHV